MKSLSKLNVIVILPTDNDKTLTAQTKATNEQLDYTYNSGGIRTGKTYSTPTNVQNVHEYTLDDTNKNRETIDQYYDNNTLLSSAELYYYYDESGIAGFEYNGTTYYFLKNIQSDVINILNASGQVVVTYTYDAWGNVVSVTGSLANTVGQINPFR